MVTTSISEGFGFSFLEPWTGGKQLWGRRLDDICVDFERRGLCLDSLYDGLPVPLAWFDVDGFTQAFRRAALALGETYGYQAEPECLDDHLEGIKNNGTIDFGVLSEVYQRQVLEHLLSDPKAKEWLAGRNPEILEPDPDKKDSATIESNRQVVQDNFDLGGYGDKLTQVYGQVIHRPVRHQVDKTVLLDAFLDLNRFSLLKWGSYEH
jgi:hypothetical protein